MSVNTDLFQDRVESCTKSENEIFFNHFLLTIVFAELAIGELQPFSAEIAQAVGFCSEFFENNGMDLRGNSVPSGTIISFEEEGESLKKKRHELNTYFSQPILYIWKILAFIATWLEKNNHSKLQFKIIYAVKIFEHLTHMRV